MKKDNEIEIVLLRAPDDPARDDPAFQQELHTFSKALHDNRVKFSERRMFFDSAAGGGFALGEYLVQLGPGIVTVLGTACVAWLHGHYARKVRLKVGDVEAEARNLQELDALLKRAADFRSGEQKRQLRCCSQQ
jgi:hypothetical protein